jgi:hypothetical protein
MLGGQYDSFERLKNKDWDSKDKAERPSEGKYTNESMERLDMCKRYVYGTDA